MEQQDSSERTALDLELGRAPGEVVPLKPAVDFPVLAADQGTADSLLSGLEERRLDLLALRRGYESQEATLRAAVLSQFPRIGVSLNKARDTTPIYTRGYGVAIDIPIFDRNQGAVAAGRATRQQLFDEYVARVAEARSQVPEIIAELAVIREEIKSVADELPGLRRTAASYDTALRAGTADAPAAGEARAAELGMEIELSRLHQQALELSVALEVAAGRPLLNIAANTPWISP